MKLKKQPFLDFKIAKIDFTQNISGNKIFKCPNFEKSGAYFLGKKGLDQSFQEALKEIQEDASDGS